jgi:hypothetical protein
MADKQEKIVLKWYHLRRVKLTREYLGGTFAGFGGGLMMASALAHYEGALVLSQLVGLCLLSLGAGMAMYAQDRYVDE